MNRPPKAPKHFGMSSIAGEVDPFSGPTLLDPRASTTHATRRIHHMDDLSPTSWNAFFDSQIDLHIPSTSNTFRVYQKISSGPVVVLLHGGGHSALSWAVFTRELSRLCSVHIVAFDFRGHGGSKTDNDDDLSCKTLCDDVQSILLTLFQGKLPQMVLIGHSMGGAIAVHISVRPEIAEKLLSMVVIDVVEGSAMDALSAMDSFLRSRPATFRSEKEAIEWALHTGQLRNPEAAKISMPPQLQLVMSTDTDKIYKPKLDSFSEADEDNEVTPTPPPVVKEVEATPVFTWRIDLTKTKVFWEGWFKGLSKLFLSTRVPKLLLLAGIDRLDKELTIAQMQGKFQMKIFGGVGHSVHEDAPEDTAEAVFGYLTRMKIVVARDS